MSERVFLNEGQNEYVRRNHLAMSVRVLSLRLHMSNYKVREFMREEKLSLFGGARGGRRIKGEQKESVLFDVNQKENWLL